MARPHHPPPPRRSRVVPVLRSAAAAAVLAAITAGLPWLFFTLAGSPIPDRLPHFDEIVTALSRRDDGTLLLGFLTYLAWGLWLAWVALLVLETGSQLSGRPAPQLPGLGGPQHFAAVLISSLGATVLGTSMSMRPATALPPPPPASHTVSTAPYTTGHLPTVSAPPQAMATTATDTALAASGQPPRQPARGTAAQALPGDRHRQTVRFAFDSAELTPDTQAALARTAEDIQRGADPSEPITLVGHTDSIGPAVYNQRLSLRRAETVRRALGLTLGDPYRFEVSGKGETAPLADERRPDGSDNPAGRARNRCVEIIFTLDRSAQAPPQSNPSPTSARTPSTPQQTAPPSTPQQPSAGPDAPATPQTPSPPTTTSPNSSPAPPSTYQPGPTVVRLPTGALVGLGLAAAISTALAATRLHRRRRRTPDPDHLGVAEPEPAPSPASRALRKAHLDTYTAAGRPLPTDHDLLAADLQAPPPTHLTAGIRGEQPVSVALAGLNIGFDGPGAAGAARAIAVDLLTAAHHSRVEVLLPHRDATALLDITDDDLTRLADAVPGLILVPDLDAALRHLETEVLHRARMMSDHNATDIAALRLADPGEPLPTIVLITHPHDTQPLTSSLTAALQLAERYGIGGILLGPWPAGTTCHIDEDGHVLAADGPDADTWKDAELFHLPATDTADLLHLTATARGAHEPADEPADEPTKVTTGQPPAPQDTDDTDPGRAAGSLHAPDLQHDQSRPVLLRLFGPVRIETTDGQLTTGLRRISRDLLAYLALHPDGITRDQGIEAIAPERDLESGTTMFHTAINNTRTALRKATGLREPMFITHAAGRYRLDPHLIDTDLWQLLRALDTARHAETDTDRAAALQQLAGLYTGELADDITHEWAETERERIRRTATDALTHLARLLHDEHPDDALAALEQAFAHDPTSEPLAQHLMRLQTQLGQPDAARRTHQLLTHHLGNLDIDPSEETDRLLTELLRRHKP